MAINLFATNIDPAGDRLQKIIEEMVLEVEVHRYSTILLFAKALADPASFQSITIALATDTDELDALLSINYLIEKTRLILLLPDDQKETKAKGHILRPRFLSYKDADFNDIGAVAARMNVRTIPFSSPLNAAG